MRNRLYMLIDVSEYTPRQEQALRDFLVSQGVIVSCGLVTQTDALEYEVIE